ncbi:MAG TPA: signal peptidase II [Polyangia bacterium]|nr:signal peptidase II [Polyangia bacterium]
MNAARKPLISLIVLLVVTIAADVITKQWAYHTLLADGFHARTDEFPVCGSADEERDRERFIRRQRKSITVVEGCWDFRYVENCASAFGLMSRVPESFRFPFFLVVSLLAAAFIPYLYRKTPPEQKLMLYALPFVLGGAVGNLIDRMVYRFVIDFVEWYVTIAGVERHWPTFNVADAAIVIGIGLMILQMLPRRASRTRPDPAAG